MSSGFVVHVEGEQHLHQRRQLLQARLTEIELYAVGQAHLRPDIGVGAVKKLSFETTAGAATTHSESKQPHV